MGTSTINADIIATGREGVWCLQNHEYHLPRKEVIQQVKDFPTLQPEAEGFVMVELHIGQCAMLWNDLMCRFMQICHFVTRQ